MITMNKITPDVYKVMNDEFIREDLPFRVTIPSQEQIDKAANPPGSHLQYQRYILAIGYDYASMCFRTLEDMLESDVEIMSWHFVKDSF